MPYGSFNQGLPGDRLTGGQGYRLASLLARQNQNNGSTAGGLAHVLQQALLGMAMKGDADKAAKLETDTNTANAEMVRGMGAKPWQLPQGEQVFSGPSSDPTAQPVPFKAAPAGDYEGGMAALSNLPGNAAAGRLSQALMMKQADQQFQRQQTAQALDNAIKLKQIPGAAQPPTAVQEYEFAKNNGFTGTFEDWKKVASTASQETFGNAPIWGTDAKGNPVLMQPSNRGGARQMDLPPGVTPQRGQTQRIDLGNEWGILDANGTFIARVPKGIAPERKVQDDRVITLPGVPGAPPSGATPAVPGAMPQPPAGAPVTPPPGPLPGPMSQAPGPMPAAMPQTATGTPQGIDITNLPPTPEAEAKAARKQDIQDRASDVVMTDIGRVLDLMETSTLPTAGFGAESLAMIPGTAARDVRGLLDTIKGNVGFDRLQQMRDASPTGGALGAINKTELETLQAVLGNVEQSQSKPQLQYNLKRLKNIYLDIVHGKGKGPARASLPSRRQGDPKPESAGGIKFLGFE